MMKAEEKSRLEHEAEGTVGGAVAGAAIGAFAGPPGAVAGAILGAVAGAIAGVVLEEEATSTAIEDQKLDGEIGVSGGELGAPNLDHPPAIVGAYSGASAGVASSGGEEEPAEGPMQSPEN